MPKKTSHKRSSPSPDTGFKVKRFPLDPKNSEIQTLNQSERIWVSSLLAPRVETIVGIRRDPCYGWGWRPDAVGMARFNRHVRRFLVEKAGFTLDELRKWTFIQLYEALEPYVREHDELLNKRQRDAFRPVYELGCLHLDHWHSRVEEAVASAETYKTSLLNGELTRTSSPYMDGEDLVRNFRMLTPDDLPWIYVVIGLKLEGIFGLDDYFVPSGCKGFLNYLPLREWYGPMWALVDGGALLQDFETWGDLIKQDLAGLKPATSVIEAEKEPEPQEGPLKTPHPIRASGGGTDDIPVALRDFMQKYCEPLSDNLLDGHAEALQRLAKREKIELKNIGEWEHGQGYKYLASYLIENWPIYQKKRQTLPSLKGLS